VVRREGHQATGRAWSEMVNGNIRGYIRGKGAAVIEWKTGATAEDKST
jgi:hypothetical protein